MSVAPPGLLSASPQPRSRVTPLVLGLGMVGAGGLVGVFDVVSLGLSQGTTWQMVALLGACGGGLGLLVAGLAMLVQRYLRQAPWRAAYVETAATLPITGLGARALFEGAYAQTLPLAAHGAVLLPILLWLCAGTALGASRWLARRYAIPAKASARWGAAAALGLALLLRWANHHFYPSGYPDVHAALALATMMAAGYGLAVGLARLPSAWQHRGFIAALLSVTAGCLVLPWGLKGARGRAAVLSHTVESKAMVRLVRELFDRDGDGASIVLGGGDCNDRAAAIHPGAADVPGNGVDEDCAGGDAKARTEVAPIVPVAAAHQVDALLQRAAAYNLLVITVDTLRADVLRSPRARVDFPHITSLLARAQLFDHAYAPGAGTDISLSTFVTGRHNPFQKLAVTLPEALAAAGLQTTVALPSEVMRYAGKTLLTRGFAEVAKVVNDGVRRDVGDKCTAPATTDAVLGRLDPAQRFFVWAHYFDVHEHLQIVPAKIPFAAERDDATPASAAYRALLIGVDGEIGRLWRALQERGLAENTVVVFFSDHGESFQEDPRLPDAHGLVVYEPLVRVPLAIYVPGLNGRELATPVSLVDVPPTLSQLLLGARRDAPPLPSFDGASLLPMMIDPSLPGGVVVTQDADQWAVIKWPHKLLVRPKDNLEELYALDVDPKEQKNLVNVEPGLVSELRSYFGARPAVSFDRTQKGRSERERLAQPPARPSPQ